VIVRVALGLVVVLAGAVAFPGRSRGVSRHGFGRDARPGGREELRHRQVQLGA
jgi:hypothetical protein